MSGPSIVSINPVLIVIIGIIFLLAVGARHDPPNKVAVLVVKDLDVNRSDCARGWRWRFRQYERASLNDNTNEILESFIMLGVFGRPDLDEVVLDLIGPKIPDKFLELLVFHVYVKAVSDGTAGESHLPKDVSLEFL